MSRAEFDHYADGYSAGMEHPLKRILGGSREAYLQPKVDWINRQFVRLADRAECPVAALHALEAGCADGALLRAVRRAGYRGALEGCDVSEQMLARAARHSELDQSIVFRHSSGSLPYSSSTFDAVIVSAVVHHIPPEERRPFLEECLRVIRPGGVLLIIEHNPWNPVTQFVVATTRIDKHARLVSARRLCQLVRTLGADVDSPEYFMFFPPRIAIGAMIERWISWFPCGGQYAIVCHKDGSSVKAAPQRAERTLHSPPRSGPVMTHSSTS